MRNSQDSSEDGSHRRFAQPAGLRRCRSGASLLSPALRWMDLSVDPTLTLSARSLLAPSRREMGCVRKARVVPSASELQEAELEGEGGGCGMRPLFLCPKRPLCLEPPIKWEELQAQLLTGFEAGTVFLGTCALPRNPVSSKKPSTSLAWGMEYGRNSICGKEKRNHNLGSSPTSKSPGLSEPRSPVPKMLLWYAVIMGSALKSVSWQGTVTINSIICYVETREG